MEITENVRKCVAEQVIAEEEELKRGMEAKSKEFVEKGRGSLQPSRKLLSMLHDSAGRLG